MGFPYQLYGGATRPDAITGLTGGFRTSLENLYAAAPASVQAELGLTSAYRSPEVQRQLWNASDKSGHMVAAPGHSEHNFGTAADLYGFGTGGGNVSQATRDWVHQNAGQYGLTFPMAYEPWHIEPMGARGQSNATTTPIPTSGHAALLAPPQTSNAADGSGGSQQPSLLQPPLSMLPPILDTNVKPGDAFSPSQILAERHPMMADAMQSFQQGYSGDRFMSDMLAGANPMRRMVFGALGNLFRSAFA